VASSVAAELTPRPEESAPPLLGWPVAGLSRRLKVLVGVLVLAAIAASAVAGALFYPRTSNSPSEIEARIIAFDRDPTVASWDDTLVGDFLVERFYILDTASGEHYIADFLKGRITDMQIVEREDLPTQEILLLDTKNMRRDKAFYSAYVSSVSHPQAMADGLYLGLVAPMGNSDAFPINYNGEIPNSREPFRVGEKEGFYEYMLAQNYKDITAPRAIDIFGYNYVLNTSDVFPLFKNEYHLDRAIFVSELLIVDATSRANRSTYYQLLEKYPRPSAP
jgi:hypothetical protein